jgi:hypothetical protein
MMRTLSIVLAVSFCASATVVLDRVAIVVNNRVIKDSDIVREVRLTSFINGQPLEFTPEARRAAAQRLIDQMLIRDEAVLAQFPEASPDEVGKLMEQVRSQRAGGSGDFGAQLKRYSLTEEQLRKHLAWQLTVLRFIEQRFRPGVLVSDEDVEKYVRENPGKFRADGKPEIPEQVREQVVEQIAGERVNQEFFDWLERARGRSNIRYVEADLK